MRRSHHALDEINIVMDSKTGEPKLPHRISLTDGYYKGKQIFVPRHIKRANKNPQ
jgi:ribosomal protein L32